MRLFQVLLFYTLAILLVNSALYQDCAKYFQPMNYMDQLPSLNLPYVNNLKIPAIKSPINPTKVQTTKVLNVVTKYIYKNPICIKYSKKTICPNVNSKLKNNMEHLITKEYFVRDQKDINDNLEDLDLFVEGSEEARPFGGTLHKTPQLSGQQLKDLLIEDRLDQLETLLPHYTRRRVFDTSTITVTKVRSNHRATATLLVKNCMPQGFDLCPPPKKKRRKSKLAQFTNSSDESHFFG